MVQIKNTSGGVISTNAYVLWGVIAFLGCGWMSCLNKSCISIDSTSIRAKDSVGALITEDVGRDSRSLRASSSINSNTCSLEGSQTPPKNEIVIDFAAVRKNALENKSVMAQVNKYTETNHQKLLLMNPGVEHYPLQQYMTQTYGDCRHIMDIGTRYVASSLALGSNFRTPVWTFDMAVSTERQRAFQAAQKNEAEWQTAVQSLGVQITFHNLDLLTIPQAEFETYIGTWFIMLDTAHLPYTVPFEREFFQRLYSSNYKGIVFLDDINLNDEMKRWWKELKDQAVEHQFQMYDVTPVGHHSGTGVVDFSGTVRLIQ